MSIRWITVILIICVSFLQSPQILAQSQKVWIDADTGNEMDDLFAIARLLMAPEIEVVGLSSAHYNNADLFVYDIWNNMPTAGLVTIQDSQRLNESILSALGLTHIAHPMGADRQIGRSWGARDMRDSPAARELVSAVSNLRDGEVLDVITLGPLTNIATAIMIAPEIKAKIHLISLAARYSFEHHAWNKNEFNVRNDLNAFDYILDQEDLHLTLMPAEVAFFLKFDREETYTSLDTTIPIEDLLVRRWREANPDHKTRIMWDLALVEAYLSPEMATLKVVAGPPENKIGNVSLYSGIDAEAMKARFFDILRR